jgi:glycosyltransferase involved in cell wall biosynthesis
MRIWFVNQPWAEVVADDPADSVSIWTAEVGRRLVAAGAKDGGSPDVVACSRHFTGAPRRERVEGMEHRRVSSTGDRALRALRLLDKRGLTPPGRPVFASTLYYPAYGRAVSRAVRAGPGDVVHVHNFSQYLPGLRRQHPDATLALHVHCEWLAFLDRSVLARRLGHADLLVTCSDYLSAQVRDRFPAFADRVATVPNGVDVDRFRPRARHDRGRRILFVGVLSPHKGVHVLIEAFQAIADAVPDAVLDLVGPEQVLTPSMLGPTDHDPTTASIVPLMRPDYPARLRQQVRPDLVDRVRFLGPVRYADMAAHYASADVVVLPSVCQEAFGLPAVEAAASGVPVVATRSGGLPEVVVDGETGLVVDRGDARAIAAALLLLLGDEPRRRALGEAGRRRAEQRFGWDGTASTLLARYREAGLRRTVASRQGGAGVPSQAPPAAVGDEARR